MSELAIKQPVSASRGKYRLLVLGLVFDLIGTLSFAVPFIGEFSDVIWAPVAGLLLKSMYKGSIGNIGGIAVFIEELLPGLDFIPTFTLTWMYTYWIKKRN